MVQFHTHTFPTATKAEAEAGLRDDVALSPKSLYGATLPIGFPADSSAIDISDSQPASPVPGDLWWQSSTGILWLYFQDVDGSQWVQVNGGTSGGGGGGGSGDDLDTTLVAPTGSTLARNMPDWLAGGPVIEIAVNAFVNADHRGAWLHMMNDLGSIIVLPNDWLPGMAFGARQIGTGTCVWEADTGASIQVPASKATHVGISEQYEEVIFRVISNSDGTHAVWGISGGTY